MDENDIERVLERVNLTQEQLGRAALDVRALPETPNWRGSSHTLAVSQQDNLLTQLQGLQREFAELAYRCERDLQRLRRQREQEGLSGGHW